MDNNQKLVVVSVNGEVTPVKENNTGIFAKRGKTFTEYIDASDAVCMIDASECSQGCLDELGNSIAHLDVHERNTLRVMLENHHGMEKVFTVEEFEDYLNTFKDGYSKLNDLVGSREFGVNLLVNFMETKDYDVIRHYFNYGWKAYTDQTEEFCG